MNKKIVILTLILVLLSGCTKRFTVEGKDNSKKSYVSNIVCKPETKQLQKVYEANKKELVVNYDDLPLCKNIKINSGGYEGLWTSIFVKPLAWLIVKLGLLVRSYGVSIMIIGLALRIAMLPLTKKSTNMSENMKKLKKI